MTIMERGHWAVEAGGGVGGGGGKVPGHLPSIVTQAFPRSMCSLRPPSLFFITLVVWLYTPAFPPGIVWCM